VTPGSPPSAVTRRSPRICAAKAGRWRPILFRGSRPSPGEPEAAARNIEAIAALEREALHHRTAIDRLTDAVTSAAGSAAFVIVHAVFFGAWIALNATGELTFDPYPFNFLMLVVSLEAIFLTSMVLMTQNRMTRQADKRAHLDLQVNLLAEQELTAMLQMLSALCQRVGVEVKVRDLRVEQLLKETDIHQLANAVDRELSDEKAVATEPESAPAPRTPSQRRS
jgi:uncharacterized membrane protein